MMFISLLAPVYSEMGHLIQPGVRGVVDRPDDDCYGYWCYFPVVKEYAYCLKDEIKEIESNVNNQ